MHNLAPYPIEMPDELISRVIEIATGSKPNAKDAHAVWHLWGYGQGKFLPDTGPVMMMEAVAAAPSMTKDEFVSAMHSMKASAPKKESAAVGGLNFPAILKFVFTYILPLVLPFLDKPQGG